MFHITQKIIKKAECHIIGLTIKNKIGSGLTKIFFFPIQYLIVGIRELFKPFSVWLFATFCLSLLGALAISKLGVSIEYREVILWIAIYFPMVLVIFAVPSTYAYYGVDNSLVEKIVNMLQEEIHSIDEVKLLEENLAIVYSRILSRISFYKWLVGAAWTIYILTVNIELRILLKVQNEGWEQVISDNVVTFLLFFLSTFLALLLIVGYKRASELIIKSIEFGCVELKYKLAKNENTV